MKLIIRSIRLWHPERWIALASVVIACCSLFVSAYTSYLNRDYLRRSQRPFMLASFYFNQEGSGFFFGNRGIGVAYVHWFQLLVDGKPVTG